MADQDPSQPRKPGLVVATIGRGPCDTEEEAKSNRVKAKREVSMAEGRSLRLTGMLSAAFESPRHAARGIRGPGKNGDTIDPSTMVRNCGILDDGHILQAIAVADLALTQARRLNACRPVVKKPEESRIQGRQGTVRAKGPLKTQVPGVAVVFRHSRVSIGLVPGRKHLFRPRSG